MDITKFPPARDTFPRMSRLLLSGVQELWKSYQYFISPNTQIQGLKCCGVCLFVSLKTVRFFLISNATQQNIVSYLKGCLIHYSLQKELSMELWLTWSNDFKTEIMTTSVKRFSSLSVFLVGIAGTFDIGTWSNVDRNMYHDSEFVN